MGWAEHWADLGDEVRRLVRTAVDYAGDLATPTLRLGVTGLSRSGKTVFIAALVHALTRGGRLPLFDALAGNRIAGAVLQPQPDDAVPRFDYEAHVKSLLADRLWPQSTRRISELRVTVDFASTSAFARAFGTGRLNLDIVDYPGEWLVDLPLIDKDYAAWSRETLARARRTGRAGIATQYLGSLAGVDADGPEDEATARDLAERFTRYLRAARADAHALSALPPGRFLMPGDLEGSPALTFAPLDDPDAAAAVPLAPRSLRQMMRRRYEAYKDIVVRPFFRDHFARLDRQIVLVDMMQALNAGPAALADLEEAMTGILSCFRPGRASWLNALLGHRIDRILFAATKADHLHSSSHDRLEAILRRLVRGALTRAEIEGAGVDVVALAAVRATREAMVRHGGEMLPAILGVPGKGEGLGGERFDGESEIALFPGDLPDDPESLFECLHVESSLQLARLATAAQADSSAEDPESQPQPHLANPLNFVRFRPPKLELADGPWSRQPGARTGDGLVLPHIRLDRALEFLIGDRLT
ncbi:MAG: YcjX family protein [Ancalomicrobiaceae bacterium]|nr:YcjX family protein [Ancalomicrobiaceae bacterium]